MVTCVSHVVVHPVRSADVTSRMVSAPDAVRNQQIVSASNVENKAIEYRQYAYSFPLVEGTPLTLLSIDVASSSALANALNTASKMWWMLRP